MSAEPHLKCSHTHNVLEYTTVIFNMSEQPHSRVRIFHVFIYIHIYTHIHIYTLVLCCTLSCVQGVRIIMFSNRFKSPNISCIYIYSYMYTYTYILIYTHVFYCTLSCIQGVRTIMLSKSKDSVAGSPNTTYSGRLQLIQGVYKAY